MARNWRSAQRLFNAPGLAQSVVADEFHHFAQVGHHLLAPAVVGGGQPTQVELLVDFEFELTIMKNVNWFTPTMVLLQDLRPELRYEPKTR